MRVQSTADALALSYSGVQLSCDIINEPTSLDPVGPGYYEDDWRTIDRVFAEAKIAHYLPSRQWLLIDELLVHFHWYDD